MSRACILATAALALAAPGAAGTPCGADRCHLFRSADGAVGAIASGPDGALWFAGNGFLGRMTLAGAVTHIAAPVNGGSDVAAGADGAVWFTTGDGRVGRVGADGAVSLFASGFAVGPAALAAGSDGAMWFVVGDVAGRIGADGRVARFSLPTSALGRDSLVAGPDGNLWMAGYHGVVRLTMSGETSATFIGLGFNPTSALSAITAGPDGGLWMTAPTPHRILRLGAATRALTFFRSSQEPRHIVAGPSHAVWFTMSGPGRPVSVVRMVPAGFQSFFQVDGGVRGMAVGANGAIYMTKGDGIQRLTPFLGAHLIRSRVLPVNLFAGSASVRLLCPKYDHVFCAGTITLRYRGRVIGSAPFSQRVNDAPATRLLLNAYGRRLVRVRARPRVQMTIVQHDQGGSGRRTTQNVFLRRR